MEPIQDQPKQLYEVLVTKNTTAYVMADSLEAATEDASLLSFTEPDFNFDEDIGVYLCTDDLEPDEMVWSGGPDGDWLQWWTLNGSK